MTRHLIGVTWDHPRGSDSVRGASAEWARRHPDVGITWDVRSLQGFADEPLPALARRYDLLVIDHPHVPEVAEEGALLPLDGAGHDSELSELASHSVGRSHESYRHGGRQYGLAIDAAAQVSVHRPDLLPEPPTSWDEVLDLAADGRVLWPAKPVDAMASLLTLCAQLGGRGDGEDPFVSREIALEALAFMVRLAALVPEACLDENPIATAERLSTGDRWWYAPLAFGYTNYSREGFRPNRLLYRDIPADADGGVAGSCLGGAGIAVSASSVHRELATEFAFWLAGGEAQAGSYFEAGGQPANTVAWDDDRCNAVTGDFFRGTRATLEQASLRPRSAHWMRAQAAIGTFANSALRGALGTTEAIDLILECSRDAVVVAS
jgi:multiple sugar transport system substrate-binding protein